MLNIPPRAQGSFDEHSQERLHELGEYMEKYGESIYATEDNQMAYGQDFGHVTRKGNTLFLHSYIKYATNKPVELTGVKGTIKSATVNGRSISYKKTVNGYSFSNVKQYEVVKVIFNSLSIDEGKLLDANNKEASLTARAAKTLSTISFEHEGRTDNAILTFSKECEWKVQVKQAGYYAIYANIATTQAGNADMLIGNNPFTFTYPRTGGSGKF